MTAAKTKSKVKIILNGIMRDEQENMEDCIKSVKHMIDAISFDDTGSLDKTVEITNAYIKKHNIPGKIWQEPWRGFQESRTLTLRHAEEVAWELDPHATWYAFFMDADNRNYGTFDKQILTADCYSLEQRSGDPFFNPSIYPFPLLIKLDREKPWNWFGPTRIHETITPPKNKDVTRGELIMQFRHWETGEIKTEPGFVHSRRAGYRSKDKYTWIGDLEACLKDIKDDHGNTRAWFYAGVSCEGGGEHEMSKYYYKKRALFKCTFPDERYVACLKVGRITLNTKGSEKAIKWFKLGINANPKRLEIPYEIIRIYRRLEQYTTGWMEAKSFLGVKLVPALFVERIIYSFHFFDEAAICAYYSGDSKTAKMLFERCLESPDVDVIVKSRIKKNIELCGLQQSKLLTDGELAEDLTDIGKEVTSKTVAPIITKLYNNKDWLKCLEICKDMNWREFPPQELLYYGVAAYWGDQKLLAFEIGNYIADHCKCHPVVYGLSVSNNASLMDLVKGKYFDNPKIKINPRVPSNPRITLLIENSGDNFEKSINSFMNCCVDIEMVDQWICTDKRISEKYPGFGLSPADEFSKVKTIINGLRSKYLVYIPANWEWIVKKKFINNGIEILESSDSILQVGFNKNFVNNYRHIEEGTEKWTKSTLRYIENSKLDRFYLHPGIYRVKHFKELNLATYPSKWEVDFHKQILSKKFSIVSMATINMLEFE